MICPYRDKTETTIQKETYHLSDDNLNIKSDNKKALTKS